MSKQKIRIKDKKMDNELEFETLVARLEQGFKALFEQFTTDEINFIYNNIDVKELVMDSLDDTKTSE